MASCSIVWLSGMRMLHAEIRAFLEGHEHGPSTSACLVANTSVTMQLPLTGHEAALVMQQAFCPGGMSHVYIVAIILTTVNSERGRRARVGVGWGLLIK